MVYKTLLIDLYAELYGLTGKNTTETKKAVTRHLRAHYGYDETIDNLLQEAGYAYGYIKHLSSYIDADDAMINGYYRYEDIWIKTQLELLP